MAADKMGFNVCHCNGNILRHNGVTVDGTQIAILDLPTRRCKSKDQQARSATGAADRISLAGFLISTSRIRDSSSAIRSEGDSPREYAHCCRISHFLGQMLSRAR
jgi:hypothetical protein